MPPRNSFAPYRAQGFKTFKENPNRLPVPHEGRVKDGPKSPLPPPIPIVWGQKYNVFTMHLEEGPKYIRWGPPFGEPLGFNNLWCHLVSLRIGNDTIEGHTNVRGGGWGKGDRVYKGMHTA